LVRELLGSVIANRFDRTAFHCFFAKLLLIGSGGLFKDVRVTAVIIAAKVARGGFAAEIAVDTLVIDVVLAREVFGIAVSDVSHNLFWEDAAYTRPQRAQYFF